MIGIAPTPSAAVRATFIVTASPTSLMTGPWYSASAGRIAAGPNGTTHPVYRRMLGSCPVSKSSINFTNISCSTTWLHVTVIFTNEAFVSRSIYTYLQDTSNNIHYRNVFHVSLKPLSSIWIFQKIGTAQSRALWARRMMTPFSFTANSYCGRVWTWWCVGMPWGKEMGRPWSATGSTTCCSSGRTGTPSTWLSGTSSYSVSSPHGFTCNHQKVA